MDDKEVLEYQQTSRRDFLKLAGVGGGMVFASALPGCASTGGGSGTSAAPDFNFVQLTDIHWGYNNAADTGQFQKIAPGSLLILQNFFVVHVASE